MSDTTDATNTDTTDVGTSGSLFSNLKNKVVYNLHKATYDPNANQFAEQQKKQKEEATKKTEDNPKDSTDTTDNSDPNKFSAKRLATKVGNQTWDIIKKIFFPFLALMLSMIVANEMIVYSAPIRIIFFIFTFLICFFSQTLGIIVAVFYLLKGGYSYYINNMTTRPKRDIMPTIFALLPISTYKPLSKLAAFFLYPFTYPKTEKGAEKLPEIMKGYWEELKASFLSLDDVKNLPIFTARLKTIQEELAHLHDTVMPKENESAENNAQQNEGEENENNSGQQAPPP